MVPHPHDDGPVERGVSLSMPAAVETVAARRHPGRRRDGRPRGGLGIHGVGLPGDSTGAPVAPVHFEHLVPGSPDRARESRPVAAGALDAERGDTSVTCCPWIFTKSSSRYQVSPWRPRRRRNRLAAVSVACRGRGRRRPRHSRAVAAQSAGGHTVLPEAVETPRPRASPADHRQAAQLLGGAPYRDAVRDPQYPAVRKQSRGSLASINPPAGAADAQVQVGRPSATVRLGARRRPESLPGRTSPAPGSSPPSLEGPFVPSVG